MKKKKMVYICKKDTFSKISSLPGQLMEAASRAR